MKTNRRTAVVLAGALLAILGTTLQLPAQEQRGKKHHHYKLIDLGTFGGPQSYINIPASYAPVLNNRGDVAGWADTSTPDPFAPNFCFNADCFVSPAFMWHDGEMRNLGVLPNGASSASNWISPNGLIAGGSENGEIDPLVPGLPEIRGVLWTREGITDLGTIEGGYESLANAVNNHGVVVGWSSNTVSDPFPGVDGGASSGIGYQTRAFLSLNGTMQDLGTLGTGTDATAYSVNEPGQVAGDSFTDQTLNTTPNCGTNAPTQNPFLWDKDKGMIDIGTLGGVCGFASGMNNRGQVVGLSDLAGDQQWHAYAWDQHRKLQDLGTFGGSNSSAIANNDAGHVIGWAHTPGDKALRAFLWRNGEKANLGALHNDPCSIAYSLNSNDQVVGVSVPRCEFDNESAYSAFLWEQDGGIIDLNTLVSRGSDLHLSIPETINDRGEIAGMGFLSNGDAHAFLLIPCDEKNLGIEDCDYGPVDPAAATPNSLAPIMQTPTHTAPRTRRFARPGLSPRHFGTQTGRLPIVENGSTVPAARIANDPVPNDTDSLLRTVTRTPPLLQDTLGTLSGTRIAGRCGGRGSQCWGQHKCCPGLICVPASTRAFCEL